MISSLALKWQVLKVGMPVLQPLYEVKSKASKFEDILTKFKSEALHVIRIKYWNASGSGKPPPFLPKIAIYVLFYTCIDHATLWGALKHQRFRLSTMNHCLALHFDWLKIAKASAQRYFRRKFMA